MRAALLRRGLSAEHAGWVAEGLLETSLRGVDTHGVRLFPTYLSELDGGRSRARPDMRWIGEEAGRAARLLDAGGALGLVAGRTAAAEAVRLARAHGVGSVAVRNSNHFGAASVYTLAMAREGFLGLSFTNSDALVAPFHGMRPIFGTNPISMAVRGEGEDLFCADFATSQVSYSKVKHHRAHGIPLQAGWAVTAEGRDAAAGEEGGEVAALQPLGNHKGHCLGMMVEILCALLAGMPFDHELSHLYVAPFDAPRQVAHHFLAFDLAAFQDPAFFRASLSRLLRLVREQPAVEGEQVIVPGDLESAETARRKAEGIPLTDEEAAAFERIAAVPVWHPGDPVEPLRVVLARGGVLAIPTESSYGLAADPRNPEGVEAVYRIKGREGEKALPVVVADRGQLAGLGIDPGLPLLEPVVACWPAPLTVVLPLRQPLPASAGAPALAVRIPAHEGLRALLADLGHGLTATSANRSG
ncbi:MAG TPA: hypothetical protein DD490_23290, partial [Acidobacteria bacterium]|nr:hypothetical protein [Acidobacteriota bacterium]